jgi:uncharacterized protein (TIGR02147 family)
VPDALPSVYDHLDFRAYLGAWFAARKAANPRYSYRLFARKAGDVSPSLLHHVIHGERNLTPATTDAFVEALGLRAGEAAFFRLLVTLGQSKDPDERNAAWEQLAATRRFREARQIDGHAFAYLSNWILPAVRELATRADFRPDPGWIAEALRPRVTPREAQDALDRLVALGMLVDDGAGGLSPADVSVTTPAEVTGLAVHNYHRGMLTLASEAITRFEPPERHLIAITVSVPVSLVPRLKAEANAFLERMMHLCDGAEADPDQVMQMNLQLFPLSDRRPPGDAP